MSVSIFRATAALTLMLALLLAACGSDEEKGATPPDDPVLFAAEIARAIEADPDNAEAILEEHELNIEAFEALMYDIAADPEKSERYQAALAAE